jgi:mannose-1-phosphate guanylyltransferase
VILAGGDGKRLLPLTRQIAGDDRPKQFCALTGGETLLEQTRRRVGQVVERRNLLLVLARTHESYFGEQVGGMPARNLLIQPRNQGTAAAIAYSLARIHGVAPQAAVAFFPSDHYFESDRAFAEGMKRAFEHVERQGQRVLLLGITAQSAEESYGWIEPGAELGRTSAGGIFEVRSFREKPSKEEAGELLSRGALWNSFVMVGRVGAFMKMMRRKLPDVLAAFERKWPEMETELEQEALEEIFSKIPAGNFSQEVLAACAGDLAVISAGGLGWADLGEPQRALSALGMQAGARRASGKTIADRVDAGERQRNPRAMGRTSAK